jgi:hypothetical protein
MAKSSLQSSISALISNPPLRSGYPCKVSVILSELVGEDKQALIDLVDHSTISTVAIAKLLNEHGYEIKYQTVSKHRKRANGAGCRCAKE